MPLRGLIPEQDKEELNRLLERAFKAENDHRFLKLHQQKPLQQEWGRIYEYDPDDPAIDNDLNLSEKKIIAHFGIYPSHMQYGKSRLYHGGIRDVATDPDPMFRGRGYGLKVMEDAKNYMFDNEVDFSILFSGAGHFYEKGGYRGGVMNQKYLLNNADLKKLLEKHSNLSEFTKEDIIIRFVEEKDFAKLNELYENTHRGLYFSMERSVEYWKNHFDTNPQLYWNYMVAEVDSTIMAYFRFELENIKNTGIVPILSECRITELISEPGSQAINIILQAFMEFVKEEAIEDSDELSGLKIYLSKNHPLYKHLIYEGYNLTDVSNYGLSIMFLITNPYSLFIRLKDEIIDRFTSKLLPSGKFFLKFDESGKFPGGIILNTLTTNSGCEINVYTTDEDFKIAKKDVIDGIYFENITGLTLIFAGIEPVDEADEDDGYFRSTGNGYEWLKGLFSNISYDHYNLDHY